MKYGEKYFKHLNYANYLERRDRYINHAKELHEFLGRLGLINKNSKILDYGCAVGFLMEGFRELGYRNVFGYDISEWAVKQAKSKGLNLIDNLKRQSFNIIVFLDVLEHMTDSEINKLFNKVKADVAIIRIPCTKDGKSFVLNVSNRDLTHINHKTKNGWIKLLYESGYTTLMPLNLFTIYDTPGVFCALGLKSKSYFKHKPYSTR